MRKNQKTSQFIKKEFHSNKALLQITNEQEEGHDVGLTKHQGTWTPAWEGGPMEGYLEI